MKALEFSCKINEIAKLFGDLKMIISSGFWIYSISVMDFIIRIFICTQDVPKLFFKEKRFM